MDWRTIDSAPLDGTKVLLFIEYGDAPVVGEYWGEKLGWHVNAEHHRVICGTYCYGGSVSTERGMKPTHWMPLPPPPSTT